MSWSVAAIGKGEAVGRALQRQFDGMPRMSEPEESIKDNVAQIVALATAAAASKGIIVRASGYQHSVIDTDGALDVRGLNLKVEIDLIALAE